MYTKYSISLFLGLSLILSTTAVTKDYSTVSSQTTFQSGFDNNNGFKRSNHKKMSLKKINVWGYMDGTLIKIGLVFRTNMALIGRHNWTKAHTNTPSDSIIFNHHTRKVWSKKQ